MYHFVLPQYNARLIIFFRMEVAHHNSSHPGTHIWPDTEIRHHTVSHIARFERPCQLPHLGRSGINFTATATKSLTYSELLNIRRYLYNGLAFFEKSPHIMV